MASRDTPRSVAGDVPNAGVWTRLGASVIHGVGVFAIKPIPKGTDVFANDAGEIVWIAAADIASTSETSVEGKLYADFAIRRGSLLGCPANFNVLSVGWYVNEPAPGEEANLMIGSNFAMIARREIQADEELTIVYASFSADTLDIP